MDTYAQRMKAAEPHIKYEHRATAVARLVQGVFGEQRSQT